MLILLTQTRGTTVWSNIPLQQCSWEFWDKAVWNRISLLKTCFCICMLVFVYTWTCSLCGCMCMETGGWHRASSSITLHLIYWGRVSHWTWTLMFWLLWLSLLQRFPVSTSYVVLGKNTPKGKGVGISKGGLLISSWTLAMYYFGSSQIASQRAAKKSFLFSFLFSSFSTDEIIKWLQKCHGWCYNLIR